MARFNAEGIEGLELSLKEYAEIPDDVVEEMLDVAADVTVKAQRRSIRALGLVDTGSLADSIKAHKKVGTIDGTRKRYILVYPTGKRTGSQSPSKLFKRARGGKAQPVQQNEVGFVHEFGAPRRGIPAKRWMQKANELCAPDVERAEFEVYDRWAQSKNL